MVRALLDTDAMGSRCPATRPGFFVAPDRRVDVAPSGPRCARDGRATRNGQRTWSALGRSSRALALALVSALGCEPYDELWMLPAPAPGGGSPSEVTWALRAGGARGSGVDVRAEAVSALADGSSIVAGHMFANHPYLEPGSSWPATATFGDRELFVTDGLFVAKASATGTWEWAIGAGASAGAERSRVRIGSGINHPFRSPISTWANVTPISTLANGACLITGHFSGSVRFGDLEFVAEDGLPGVDARGFVAKVSATGAWEWVVPSSGPAQYLGVVALADGSALVSGWFWGAAASFGGTELVGGPEGFYDFVAKVSAAGEWEWAMPVRGRVVGALPDGAIIVTGRFDGVARFGDIELAGREGGPTSYVARLSGTGEWEWAVRIGSGSGLANEVSALPDGSTIVAGLFGGTTSFGGTQLVATGSPDAFVAKLSPLGSWEWAARAGGAAATSARAVSVLSNGSSIVVGSATSGSTSFGRTTLVSAAGSEAFVAKVSPTGTWEWAVRAAGSLTAVSALSNGSSIVVGFFHGPANFGETALVGEGSSDAVVWRLPSNPSDPPPSDMPPPSGRPPPSEHDFTCDASAAHSLCVEYWPPSRAIRDQMWNECRHQRSNGHNCSPGGTVCQHSGERGLAWTYVYRHPQGLDFVRDECRRNRGTVVR